MSLTEEPKDYQPESDMDPFNNYPVQEDHIPINVRLMLEETTQSFLGHTKTYNQILFNDDPDAIAEMEDGLGGMDLFTGKKLKKRNTIDTTSTTASTSTSTLKNKKIYRSCLDEIGQSKMGSIHIAYSLGDYTLALAQLKALIQTTPNAFEPWVTIGTIYEEKGDIEKSQGALFMAAYLHNNHVIWNKIANQSMYQNTIIIN